MKAYLLGSIVSSILLLQSGVHAEENLPAWTTDGKCYIASWDYPYFASVKATSSATVNGVSYSLAVPTGSTASVAGNLSVEKIQIVPGDGDNPAVKVTPTANYTAGGEFSQTFIRNIDIANNNTILALGFSGSASATKSDGGTISASATVAYETFTLMAGGTNPVPTPTRQTITKTCKAGEAPVNIAGGLTAPTAATYMFSFRLTATGTGTGTADNGGTGGSAAGFKYSLL